MLNALQPVKEKRGQATKSFDPFAVAKLAFLLFVNALLFVGFYTVGLYKLDAFASVGTGIQTWPIPSVIRSFFILGWMFVPVIVVTLLINKKWLKLSVKTFLLTTIASIMLMVMIIETIIKLI